MRVGRMWWGGWRRGDFNFVFCLGIGKFYLLKRILGLLFFIGIVVIVSIGVVVCYIGGIIFYVFVGK